MKHKLPKYVRRKMAKGKAYYYFDTGQKDDKGRAIMKPLPDVSDMTFGRALAAASAMRTRRAKPEPAAFTVAKLIDLFEKSPALKKKAKGTRTSYLHYLPQIRNEMGEAPIGDVTSADVQMLMDNRGETPAAANQIVRVVGALYKWARGNHYTKLRPTEGVELNEIGEHDPWPEWLIEEALRSDDRLVSLATALLYFTAQRIGDVLRMRWTDIRGNRIEVHQEKTGEPLQISIHGDLAAHLDKAPRHGLTILSTPDAKPYKQDVVRRALQAFAAAHGVKVVPHGLRKNAVNALLEAGCSTWEVQAISGQSPAVIEHYAKRRNKTKLGDAAVLKWQRK